MFRYLPPKRAAVLAGLAGLLIAAPTAQATEYTAFVPLWIEQEAENPGTAQTVPGLLSIPPAWQPGCGAAIVIGAPQPPGGPRDGVVARLLGEGALVLELDVFTARGFAADNAATPPLPDAAALLRDLFAALAVLRREYDPGLVAALGFGIGGDAALRAPTVRLRDGGSGFVAGIHAGPGPMRFARGASPDAAEGWPLRLRSLCRAVSDPADPDAGVALRRCEVALSGESPQAARR